MTQVFRSKSWGLVALGSKGTVPNAAPAPCKKVLLFITLGFFSDPSQGGSLRPMVLGDHVGVPNGCPDKSLFFLVVVVVVNRDHLAIGPDNTPVVAEVPGASIGTQGDRVAPGGASGLTDHGADAIRLGAIPVDDSQRAIWQLQQIRRVAAMAARRGDWPVEEFPNFTVVVGTIKLNVRFSPDSRKNAASGQPQRRGHQSHSVFPRFGPYKSKHVP